VSSIEIDLEAPKSDNFVVKISVSGIFVDLMSLWKTDTEAVECRYVIALAVSSAILNLSFQDKGFSLWP
jgi:hypothetical protein